MCVCDNSIIQYTFVYAYVYIYIGTLCGKCPNGTGVSALLNRCVTCSKKNLILVAALGKSLLLDENKHFHIMELSLPSSSVLLDALAMGIIVFCDWRLPQIFYPFVFYIQVSELTIATKYTANWTIFHSQMF